VLTGYAERLALKAQARQYDRMRALFDKLENPVVTGLTATNILTSPGYTPANGDQVSLEVSVGGGALPAGLTAGTVYYVVSASGTTFKLSLTSGGASITLTADGEGLLFKHTPFAVTASPSYTPQLTTATAITASFRFSSALRVELYGSGIGITTVYPAWVDTPMVHQGEEMSRLFNVETLLTPDQVAISDEAILAMIRDYTAEAGVRNLERKLANVMRKIARKVASAPPAPAADAAKGAEAPQHFAVEAADRAIRAARESRERQISAVGVEPGDGSLDLWPARLGGGHAGEAAALAGGCGSAARRSWISRASACISAHLLFARIQCSEHPQGVRGDLPTRIVLNL